MTIHVLGGQSRGGANISDVLLALGPMRLWWQPHRINETCWLPPPHVGRFRASSLTLEAAGQQAGRGVTSGSDEIEAEGGRRPLIRIYVLYVKPEAGAANASGQ